MNAFIPGGDESVLEDGFTTYQIKSEHVVYTKDGKSLYGDIDSCEDYLFKFSDKNWKDGCVFIVVSAYSVGLSPSDSIARFQRLGYEGKGELPYGIIPCIGSTKYQRISDFRLDVMMGRAEIQPIFNYSYPDGGGVYFLQCNDGVNNYIKIGYAGNFRSRLAGRNVMNPYNISIIATCNGATIEDEKALHKRFEKAHVRGEWFRPTAELIDYISLIRLNCSGSITSRLEESEHCV